MKPYFEANGVTVYHGDMRDYQHLVGDALITDPPYGTGSYATDIAMDPDIIPRWISAFQSVALMAYPEILVGWLLAAGARSPDEWVTWWPTNKVGARGSRIPQETEHIAVFGSLPGVKMLRRPRSKEGSAIVARGRGTKPVPVPDQNVAGKSTRDWAQLGDVWRDPAPGMGFNSHLRLHKNEKPLSLGEKLVTLCTLPGQTVIDYHCGSGTFLLAAHRLGRRAIGVELDEESCETVANRFQQGNLSLPTSRTPDMETTA